MELRVAWGLGMQDAEVFDLVQGQVVAGEMQPGVKEHGAMASTEDEAIAIQPFRISRIALEAVTEKNSADIGCAKGQAEVTGGALMHRVHGESTGFVGGLGKEGGVHV